MASSGLTGSYGYTDTLKGVHFGPGSTKTALPKLLNTIGAKKALVVTGRSLFTKVGIHFFYPAISSYISILYIRQTL